MAAIVAGNSLGLSLTSLSTLGQNAPDGAATTGRNGERVYVNAVTGNLVVQGQDEFVASRGADLSVVRTYDSIGNLRWVGDAHSQVLMNYDMAGNRVSVFTHVINTDGLTEIPNDTQRYFQYDSMNRQTVVDAIDAAGNINRDQGHQLTYDLNGNRTSDTFFGKVVHKIYRNGDPDDFDYKASTALGQLTETYRYDALNRLTSIQRSDGRLFGQVDGDPDPQIDARKYDLASRVTQTGGDDWLPANYLKELYGRDANGNAVSGNGSRKRETYFNADGQQVVQAVRHTSGAIDYRQINDTFDGAGNLTAYRVLNSATNNYGVAMRPLDGYREASVSGTSTAFEPGTSTSHYDANGHLQSVTQPGQVDRSYVNDLNGQVLATLHGTRLMRQLIVNGEVLGQYGSGVDAAMPRAATGQVVYDNNMADFQLGYRSITPAYPLAAPGAYVVRSGDTLRSIAQQAYGDSRRWFQVADANGIQGDSDLRVGLTLNLPNLVGGAHNGAGEFQPYDPSRMVGDTTPYMPPKPADGNLFGELLMIVVAMAVSIMLPGMAGAILGSLASQTVGIAAGLQDFYEPAQLAMAGLAASASMYMARLLPVNSWLADSGWAPAAARTAMANTITQGLATAAGHQSTMNWKEIVASAGGAAIGEVVGRALGTAWGASRQGNLAAEVATRLAASTTSAVLRGGRVQLAPVMADAFGNALGSSLVLAGWGSDAANAPATRGQVLASNRYSEWTSDQTAQDAPGIIGRGPEFQRRFSEAELYALSDGLQAGSAANARRMPLDDFGNSTEPIDGPTLLAQNEIARENRVLALRSRTITSRSPTGIVQQDGKNYYLITRDHHGLGVYQRPDDSVPEVANVPAEAPSSATTLASPAVSTSRTPLGWQLGDLSMKYETGKNPGQYGAAAGVVSTGVGDKGGISYGAYQLASSRAGGEHVQNFLRSEGSAWAGAFEGMDAREPGPFGQQWKRLAQTSPEQFFSAQHAYIQRSHYEPVVKHLFETTGLKIRAQPPAVQDVVWSAAVQHGKAKYFLTRAVNTADQVSSRSSANYPVTLINAIYDRRVAYVSSLNIPNKQSLLQIRYPDERQRALQMLNGRH
ncbi:MAG: LysM domain-containing protein [Pseudomonadota bacterium]